MIAASRKRGLSVTAYSPIARGRVKGDAVLSRIGKAHGKTAAQVCLRYLVQQDIIVIPRTSQSARLKENFASVRFQAVGRGDEGDRRARESRRPHRRMGAARRTGIERRIGVMPFAITKILGFFALPSNLLFLLTALGVGLLFTRFTRAGRRLAATAVVLLALAGYSPLGNALMLPLEQRFPPWDSARGAPDGIVVLGGAINPVVSAARGAPALNEAAERFTAAVDAGAALSRRAADIQRRRRQPYGRWRHRGGPRAPAA